MNNKSMEKNIIILFVMMKNGSWIGLGKLEVLMREFYVLRLVVFIYRMIEEVTGVMGTNLN